eukprot:5466285-Pyramimonas_sp.AAC.1
MLRKRKLWDKYRIKLSCASVVPAGFPSSDLAARSRVHGAFPTVDGACVCAGISRFSSDFRSGATWSVQAIEDQPCAGDGTQPR